MSEGTDTTTTNRQDQTSSSETNGSTEARTAPETTSSTSSGPAPADDAGAAETPWQDALDGDLKTDPLFRGYRSVDDLAKAHRHLTKLKGATAAELLKIPGKPQDQDPEGWAPIHKALGVPDDPAAYQIELAPEAAADGEQVVAALRELGGKAKFQPGQMAAVVETLNAMGKAAAEAEAKALDAETKATTETLDKEWGAAAEGNRRGIGKLIREAIDASVTDIKDPTQKKAAVDEAMADLQGKLGSNLTLSRVLAHALSKMAEPEAPENGVTTPAKALTPTAATAALNAFYANTEKTAALNDRAHPQHAAVMEERRALLAQQRGDRRPDQPGG